MPRRPLLVVPLAIAALVVGGCGLDDPDPLPPDGDESPSAAPSATPSAEPSASPSQEPSQEPSPAPSPDPSPSELAGEPFDGPPLYGAPATMLVIGVAADDVLNVRAGPGVDEDVVATLAPLAADIALTGRARLLPGSIWAEIEVADATGWVNSSFLAFPGRTTDITSQVLDAAGTRPRAETLVDLAQQVGRLRASVEPASRLVITDGPSLGDLGEVTIDVVGLGDDAQYGERLVVFATVDDSTFTLRTVEATALCGRAVTDDGLCV